MQAGLLLPVALLQSTRHKLVVGTIRDPKGSKRSDEFSPYGRLPWGRPFFVWHEAAPRRMTLKSRPGLFRLKQESGAGCQPQLRSAKHREAPCRQGAP